MHWTSLFIGNRNYKKHKSKDLTPITHPDVIAGAMVEEISKQRSVLPVEANGAARAATMLAELF